jgi:hypothetical protein
MKRIQMLVLLGVFALSVVFPPLAQTAPLSSTRALTLATQATTALTGGVPVSDVTLNANVTWIAGSDNLTGIGTLQAKGNSESRVDLNLGDTTRTEVRATSDGIPQGEWIKPATASASAKPHPYATHNCWTDASWFFPALSSITQVSNPNYVFSYVGLEQHGGVSTQHIRVTQMVPQDAKGTLALQRLSAMDFYLEPTSLLPLAIAFKVHPDNDMSTDVPMEIHFANYQSVNGVRVPFHIQRMLNGTVVLDVVVTNAAVNTGLSDSDFSLQ